jgi:hypothetical protein
MIEFSRYIYNDVMSIFRPDLIHTEDSQLETPAKQKSFDYNPRFFEFIELFARIGDDSRLFPKKCRTCGQEYKSFPDYIHRTEALAHGLADYSDALDVPRTMQYRNCRCGSTLAIIFTKDVYPLLDKFWEMLGRESKESGRPFSAVVSEFREQCNRYVIENNESQNLK